MLITLDFSSFRTRVCKGLDIPNHENSDYELWNIKAIEGSDCQLGRKETIVRKKIDSFCFNGVDFEKKIFNQVCKCSDQDYECDSGYSRDSNGPCKLTNVSRTNEELFNNFWGEHPSNANLIQNCTDFYHIPSGYRKIPGDQCKGGVSYEPVKIPCPTQIKLIDDIKE